MHSNFTDVRTVKEAGAHLQYKLEGLGNKISFILLVLVNNLNLDGREEDGGRAPAVAIVHPKPGQTTNL